MSLMMNKPITGPLKSSKYLLTRLDKKEKEKKPHKNSVNCDRRRSCVICVLLPTCRVGSRRRIGLAAVSRHAGCVDGGPRRVHVGFLLELADVFLVSDSLVAKPVWYLWSKATGAYRQLKALQLDASLLHSHKRKKKSFTGHYSARIRSCHTKYIWLTDECKHLLSTVVTDRDEHHCPGLLPTTAQHTSVSSTPPLKYTRQLIALFFL